MRRIQRERENESKSESERDRERDRSNWSRRGFGGSDQLQYLEYWKQRLCSKCSAKTKAMFQM